MKKNTKVILGILLIVTVFALGKYYTEIRYNISKLYVNQLPDNKKIETEYESLNGMKDIKYNVKLKKDNPYVYTDYKGISSMISNNENFVAYFGFPECPYCRVRIEDIADMAKNAGIDKVYYVDIDKNKRSEYSSKDNGKTISQKYVNADYDKLLDQIGYVFPFYYIDDAYGQSYDIDKHRIYAPSLIYYKNGTAIRYEPDPGYNAEELDKISENNKIALDNSLQTFFSSFLQ